MNLWNSNNWLEMTQSKLICDSINTLRTGTSVATIQKANSLSLASTETRYFDLFAVIKCIMRTHTHTQKHRCSAGSIYVSVPRSLEWIPSIHASLTMNHIIFFTSWPILKHYRFTNQIHKTELSTSKTVR